MPARLPAEVHSLLSAASQMERDTAWADFVSTHTRLMLYAARSVIHDRDDVMDAYAYTLERLREDESHRLRGFRAEQGTLFSTWLVVVVRRICVDFMRRRLGRRPPSPAGVISESHAVRRRLVELIGEPATLENVRDGGTDPEESLEARELHDRLECALRTLTAADRLLLALRFEDDCSASRIAQTMRLPTPFHVYRRLNTILATLRRRLRATGVEGPDG